MLFRRNADSGMSGRTGRSDATAPDGEGADEAGGKGKGRPTPTRKEAEAARKARLKAQAAGRRTGARADREAARAERLRVRAALASGDEKHLPARDKGPARRFARDYVDARRTIGEFMLPAMILLIPLTLMASSISNLSVRAYVVLATYLFMLTVVAGTTWLAFRVKREAARRFPDENVRGVGIYAAMRSLQLRRYRLPKPRVRPGADV
ncbi:MAG: DUF3043 domain-containing protein [Candidatus Limnocylindrales bacterium]